MSCLPYCLQDGCTGVRGRIECSNEWKAPPAKEKSGHFGDREALHPSLGSTTAPTILYPMDTHTGSRQMLPDILWRELFPVGNEQHDNTTRNNQEHFAPQRRRISRGVKNQSITLSHRNIATSRGEGHRNQFNQCTSCAHFSI